MIADELEMFRIKSILLINDGSDRPTPATLAARALSLGHNAELSTAPLPSGQDPAAAGFVASLLMARPSSLVVASCPVRDRAGNLVHGSMAAQLYAQARSPLLLFGPHAVSSPRCEFHRILLVAGTRPESAAAARTALLVARRYQAELLVLHIAPNSLDAAGQQRDLQDAERRLGAWIGEQCVGLWRTPKLLLERGAAAPAILARAREYNSDLIVIGACRDGNDEAQAAWAIVYQLLCAAAAPVMTICEDQS